MSFRSQAHQNQSYSHPKWQKSASSNNANAQSIPSSSNIPFSSNNDVAYCKYCKRNVGHTIEDCARKKQSDAKREQISKNSFLNASAPPFNPHLNGEGKE